jgi:hypothetical protein
MPLSLKAFAITAGLVWGVCLLAVGVVNFLIPSYGIGFLDAMRSVYPGYHNARTITNIVVGSAYGLVDGAIGGLVFAWVYNLVADQHRRIA